MERPYYTFKTKNKKLYYLAPTKSPFNYQVPIINFSDFEIDATCLKYGLHHSFIDKKKFIKRDLGLELQSLASSVDIFVPQVSKEEFHQFLRKTTYKLSNITYRTRDNMYPKTKFIRDNRDIIILSGYNDSSMVIMNKQDYNKKIDDMIIEEI